MFGARLKTEDIEKEILRLEAIFHATQYGHQHKTNRVRQHLELLGRLGIERLTKETGAGPPLLPPSETLRTGWTFKITKKTISWYHTKGKQRLYGECTVNNVLHFLDRGTKAHGPRVKAYMHFTIEGTEYFRKWVKGIDPQKIFNQLRAYIIQQHKLHWKE